MREDGNSKQCKVVKNNNFTIMSNIHLRNKELSLKAKGLMSLCLSLPETWDYSIAGLVTLSTDGRDSVSKALEELKKMGFLVVENKRTEKGTFKTYYTFYENPEESKTITDFPTRENASDRNGFSDTDKPMQINRCSSTDSEKPEQINTNNKELKLNTKKSNKENKSSFGEFKNVFLTSNEVEKLKAIWGASFSKGVEKLSSYKEASGKKYKSDYAVLNKNNWVYKSFFGEKQNSNVQEFKPPSSESKYARCYG